MNDIGVQKEIFAFMKAAFKQVYQFRKNDSLDYEKNFIESYYALREAFFNEGFWLSFENGKAETIEHRQPCIMNINKGPFTYYLQLKQWKYIITHT